LSETKISVWSFTTEKAVKLEAQRLRTLTKAAVKECGPSGGAIESNPLAAIVSE